jgi:phage tail sheath protein FI
VAYKTPGVYIVEKNAFPNSVVEVATAVPAFIGHTEYARSKGKSLLNKPWRITSMSEYAEYFGDAPHSLFSLNSNQPTAPAAGKEAGAAGVAAAATDDAGAQQPAAPAAPPAGGEGAAQVALPVDFSFPRTGPPSPDKDYVVARTDAHYSLYASMQLFFQNGGGPCYIVSVGSYLQDFSGDLFTQGIDQLKKEMEPTMVVIPEAVLLDQQADCIKVQQAILQHCGVDMKNRFAILDVYNGFQDRSTDPDPISTFRDSLGTNSLKFAAAYYPWLETSILSDSDVSYRNVDEASRETLRNLLSDDLKINGEPPSRAIQLKNFEELRRAVGALDDRWAVATLKDGKAVPLDANGFGPAQHPKDEKNPPTYVYLKDGKVDGASTEAGSAPSPATPAAQDGGHSDPTAPGGDPAVAGTPPDNASGASAAGGAGGTVKPPATLTQEQIDDALVMIKKARLAVHQLLSKESSLYKTLLHVIAAKLNRLPPSAAIAGLFTSVDNARGVWKAPANVSLNAVVAPSVSISHEEQEDLNVTTGGKSINAIRAFIGAGVMVWGARTLDGNSLDWRYVNVRRTMIMIEESLRLAMAAYVFEPNTANTWVTVKGMASNFLTNIWKRGGLAGASADDAFSVQVGLGSTMTADDILEGRMNVTILLALSRPAEFIELTFQQQMQKS